MKWSSFREGWTQRYKAGETLDRIAAAHGCCKSTVRRQVVAGGASMRRGRTPGQLPWQAVAKQLRTQGLTYDAIAARVGLSKTRVFIVTRGIRRRAG